MSSAIISFLGFLLTISYLNAHTVYFEGQNPKINPTNTRYDIVRTNPGIVITDFGKDSMTFNDPENMGISLGIVEKYTDFSSGIPSSFQNCKIYSSTTGQFLTDFNLMTLGFPLGYPKNFDTGINLQCTQANVTNYMIVIQSKHNVDYVGYSLTTLTTRSTQYVSDKLAVFTAISLQPATPYFRSLQFNSGSSFKVSDSTPQKAPTYTVNASSIFQEIPTKNYLFTTFFLTANVTMEVVPHLKVCSGIKTIAQADLNQLGVYVFPSVTLNGLYDCTFKMIPPSKAYYTKVVMNGFLTNSFYAHMAYTTKYSNIFTPEGNNLLTGTYYFPYDGQLSFDSGQDGFADFGFTVEYIKLPIQPYVLRTFETSGQGNLSDLAGIISQFAPKYPTQSLAVLSVNPDPSSLFTRTHLDYCFLTLTNNGGGYQRYSLREFSIFTNPILFQSALFQCVEYPKVAGKVIIVVGNTTDWNSVCKMAGSFVSTLNTVSFPYDPKCLGFNTFVQVMDYGQTSATINQMEASPADTQVLALRGVVFGTYVASVTQRNTPVTTSLNYVTYLGESTANITLHWKNGGNIVPTATAKTTAPRTTTLKIETTTTKAAGTQSFALFSLTVAYILRTQYF